jgi:hypothetical protein
MKRILLCFLFLSLFIAAAPPAAKAAQPAYKTIVVKHFVNANGTNQSPAFVGMFCDEMRKWLQKFKVGDLVVEESATVSGADAANSVVVEGRFTNFEKSGVFTMGSLEVEFSLYRLSDHALVKTLDSKSVFKSSSDKIIANQTGDEIAYAVRKALKDVNLASIPAAPPPAPAPAPVAAVATPPAAAAQAFVTIDSTPPDADIEIDGSFVGNTPSTVAVAPGSHQIAVKKKGFADWSKTLNVTGGSVRLNAELEAAHAQL